MLEKTIETYLCERAKALGGKAWKWTSPGSSGVPDRMVTLPGARIVFVETKAPGKKSRPLQRKVQADLRRLGFAVYADVDSKDKVDALLGEVMSSHVV